MANVKTTMFELRMMLRYFQNGMSEKSISEKMHLSRTSIRVYKGRVAECGKSYTELSELSDSELSLVLTKKAHAKAVDKRFEQLSPLLEGYACELGKRYVGYDTLWGEYQKQYPDGYSYNRFRELLKDYEKSHRYVYRNTYAPGNEMQIDFAGDKLWLSNKKTGEKTPVVVLCCIFPYSSMSFVMALYRATMEHYYYGISQALNYFRGVPALVKSDNMQQWVKRSDRYEPCYNEAAIEWGLYYGTELDAARVRRPRDKGPVEGLVYKAYKYIYAKIRNEVFYSLNELNGRIFELLDEFNNRPMQGRSYSRLERFETEELPLLKALPAEPYMFKYSKEFTVNSTYHVSVGSEKHFYSVPYQYVNKKATVVYDNETVEIYVNHERIALHKRTFEGGYTSSHRHMPPNHIAWQRSREYNADYFMRHGALIGQHTTSVMRIILESKPFIQQAYKSCQGILSLARRYSAERVEAACIRSGESAAVNYTMIKRILEKGLDKEINQDIAVNTSYMPENEEVRGASSYQ